MEPLRIGILGAARIAPSALVRPAAEVGEAQVVAIAARDEGRARRFASELSTIFVKDVSIISFPMYWVIASLPTRLIIIRKQDTTFQ